jgi:hypothetical protein
MPKRKSISRVGGTKINGCHKKCLVTLWHDSCITNAARDFVKIYFE